VATSDLILVRHGESTGNVAREAAEGDGAELIAIEQRDADVPLSTTGTEQAVALGRWWAGLPAERRPTQVWSSPYYRAWQTAEIALRETGRRQAVLVDERLRDRELGILDRLTARGVAVRYPGEAQRRRTLGKLYYRPPGGESWADVALRLRSFWRDLVLDGPVLIVGHDAVIVLFRYLLEGWGEAELLTAAAGESPGNGSVTRLTRDGPQRPWRVVEFNQQAHLAEHGAAATQHGSEPDAHPRT
jgi:broad specificity phosphatase PhoE